MALQKVTYDSVVKSADPNFNHKAAREAYELVMKMDDDEAQVFTEMIVANVTEELISKNLRTLQRDLDRVVAKRIYDVKRATLKVAITGDKDAVAFSKALVDIEKAVRRYDAWDSHDDELHPRDPVTGRFRVRVTRTQSSPLSPKNAKMVGIPITGTERYKSWKPAQQAQFQDEYRQLANFMDAINNSTATPGESDVYLHFRDKNRTWYEKASSMNPEANTKLLDPTKHALIGVEARPNTLTLGGATFGLMGALGMRPHEGDAAMVSQVNALGGNMSTFAGSWDKQTNGKNRNEQMYGRLASGSRFLSQAAPPGGKVQQAALFAQFVGEHGPEAEQVIGPHARKAAYRYRGVTKTPDKVPLDRYNTAVQSAKSRSADTTRMTMTQQAAHRVSTERRAPTDAEVNAGVSELANWLFYDSDAKPKAGLYNLQLAAGNTPPSEGFIIDRHGKVVSQAVGYGDDHYLPFNLKHLSKLRGGQYVRTRSVGGPTSEDVYTALMTGAKRVTVVSRSGVFSFEINQDQLSQPGAFDRAEGALVGAGAGAALMGASRLGANALRGRGFRVRALTGVGRAGVLGAGAALGAGYLAERTPHHRDKALRITNRYQQILDAVQSQQVERAQVPDDIQEAIRIRVTRKYGNWMNRQDLDDRVKKEIQEFKENPEITHDDEELAQIMAEKGFSDLPTNRQFREMLQSNRGKTRTRAEQEYVNQKLSDIAAQKEFKFRLNGIGYEAALDSLHEQFPYYINVKSYPRLDEAERAFSLDRGYVEPGRNRPTYATAGLFGAAAQQRSPFSHVNGKFSAAEADYQRGRPNGGGGGPESPSPVSPKQPINTSNGKATPVDNPGGPTPAQVARKIAYLPAVVKLQEEIKRSFKLDNADASVREAVEMTPEQLQSPENQAKFHKFVQDWLKNGRDEKGQPFRLQDPTVLAAYERAAGSYGSTDWDPSRNGVWGSQPLNFKGKEYEGDENARRRALNEIDTRFKSGVLHNKPLSAMTDEELSQEFDVLTKLKGYIDGGGQGLTPDQQVNMLQQEVGIDPSSPALEMLLANQDQIPERMKALHQVRAMNAGVADDMRNPDIVVRAGESTEPGHNQREAVLYMARQFDGAAQRLSDQGDYDGADEMYLAAQAAHDMAQSKNVGQRDATMLREQYEHLLRRAYHLNNG